MKYFLIMMAVFSGISNLAAKHRVFDQYANIIRRPDNIAVFTISANPVKIKVQDTSKKYVEEYLVLDTILLMKASKAVLKKAVLQIENYAIENIKRCPFEGRYAAVFTKGKRRITLIISSSACGKAQVYLPGKVAGQPYDLADGSGIEKALNK